MKTIKFFSVAFALLFAPATFAADVETGYAAENIVTVKASRVSKALVEAWATAYMKVNPEVKVMVVGKQGRDADLSLVNADETSDEVTVVGRSAILPVTTVGNPLSAELRKRHWSKSDLRKLYFSSLEDEYAEDDEPIGGKLGKLRDKLTVYSSANAGGASSVFATYFGYQVSELRGNRISGDDAFLINAIEDDKASITFNNVAYLYNTTTRTLKSELLILPLNLKNDQQRVLQGGNLDETIKMLETEKTDLIPIVSFGFSYKAQKPSAKQFIDWVASEGQAYNHQKGFLRK